MSDAPETTPDAAADAASGNTPILPAAEIPMVMVAAGELSALKERAARADEYLTLAKYAKADFINYQDRVRKEKADWNRIALTSFAGDLLSAVDGFSMANFEDPKLNEAIRILEKEFVRVLSKHGITPIDVADQPFNPMFHDAIAIEPQGTKLQEARRGWMIDGKVLRPASVRIVKG